MAMLVYTDPSGRELTVPLGPEAPVVSIGRATDCTIRSNRKSVSRRHAEFHYKNGHYEVVDLNSSNGTYLIVNDERKPVVQPQPLNHSDEVWCGDFILRFYEEEDAAMVGGPSMGAGQGLQVHGQQENYPAHRVTHDFGQSPTGNDVQGNFSQRPPSGQVAPLQGAGFVQAGSGTPPPQGNLPQNNMGASLGAEISSFELEPDFSEQDFGGGQDGAEIQRLRDEKQSIEDLASRQAREIDDLRAELETLRAAAAGAEDVDRLSMELEAAQREQSRLEDELRQTQGASLELEQANERAETAENRLQEASEKIDDLRRHLEEVQQKAGQSQDHGRELETLQQELENRSRDIGILEQELERTQKELQDVRAKSSSSDETAQLRKEVERQERLLGEFEKRSRELQAELTQETEAGQSLRELVGQYETRIDELEDQVETLSRDRDEAQGQLEETAAARDEAASALSELEETERDLRTEIEGLKQRLRLEKQRSKGGGSDDSDALQQQVESLQAELELARNSSPGEGLSSQILDTLAEHARTLDRIVDAIERTDLGSLSTVDRVRLQSAIRDTQPRQTLSAILDLVGAEE